MNAKQLANAIVKGINEGTLPAASLNVTASALMAGWDVSEATAVETTMILRDNYKLTA